MDIVNIDIDKNIDRVRSANQGTEEFSRNTQCV